MSTAIIVGEPPLIMIGTDNTDSIVTNANMSPTSITPPTCGRMISTRMRSPPAPRLAAASMVARSRAAIASETSSATNGVCFHTKVTTMPRQSSSPDRLATLTSPSAPSVLFMRPFLARKVRMHCAATMNGMKSGQR